MWHCRSGAASASLDSMRKRIPAALAIGAIWAAVAAVGVKGGDVVVDNSKDDRTHRVTVPIVAGVALFAAFATIFVALIGLRTKE